MTPQQLWKLAFRTAEAKLRTSGSVFSEAEIMAEFPTIGLVGDEGYPKYLGHVETIEIKHDPRLEVELTIGKTNTDSTLYEGCAIYLREEVKE